MGPRWAKKGVTRNGPSRQDNSWRPLGPILGPLLAILSPTWPFEANLEANMTLNLLPGSLQTHRKTSKQPLCNFPEGSLPPEICKKTMISQLFLMFLRSQLLATLHPKIRPSKPKMCLKMPSGTPQNGPRRAQDSPRWAQDGPKKG